MRTALVGAASLITAAVIGGVVATAMTNGEPQTPQEVRIVNETGEPVPSPSAQPEPLPTPSEVLPSPLPAPKLACTRNAPENSPCKSTVPRDDSPQPRASTRG